MPDHALPSSDAPTPSPDASTPSPDASVVELTRALVAVPSVNPEMEEGGDGEEAVARLVADWLEGHGFETSVTEPAPGRFNLVARLVPSPGMPDSSPGPAHSPDPVVQGPRIILCGHLDTVGVAGMEIDPFDPVIRDGRLYGRGSADMKGGVAAILRAAADLATRGGPARGELLVVLTADEEHASVGLRALLDGGLQGDEAIVCEPTDLEIHTANKGFSWVDVEVRGRAAHGSRPDLGRDAIRDAGRILAALDRYELELGAREPHPLLGRGSIHAGTIRGGRAPALYPDRCDLVLEARTLPGESVDQVRLGIQGIVAELSEDRPMEVELRQGLSRPAAEIPSDHPLVERLDRAIRAEGRAPKRAGMSAWVESAWFIAAGIPAVCFGPGSIAQAHTAVEFVPIEELEAAARILSRYLEEALLGAPPGARDAPGRPGDTPGFAGRDPSTSGP